ncbi:hypothetical protein CDL12_22201 [Handroanthus impetiginosus]|uniref:Pentacotripeptide-repeat region of PRORP domain-containing protein n=1 Tax=Handroanthus impetiginosus TaxID=429701 RepID=A0A2G9GIY7_9LAMI|nr:hypothetical protein CDL12_22201 [Handroanthus impetiginosus]
MRYLFKGGISCSNSCSNLLNSHILAPGVAQLVCLSILSSKSLKNSKKVHGNSALNHPKELQGFGPLFDEILGILGTENIAVDKDAPYGFSVSKETQLKGNAGSLESSSYQLQGVCGNAKENGDHIKMGTLLDIETKGNEILDDMKVKDVSPIVHKVTEIVRSECAAVSMEERLENADFNYEEEVVEKVLKRCFKVPHLALRFFNWVKLRDGFRHSTDTFNTMISIAGEAKDFDLVEELVAEMEKCSCEKNVKTWTVLVSCYGKAKMIGKALFVFDEMKKAGFEPDAIAYRIMLDSLCNARKADLALEFYKDMVHNEVNLDLGLYKRLLKCFALYGDVSSVRLVGENMIKFSEISEAHVYGLMLTSFCMAGRIRESLELIRELKDKNIILDAGFFETLVKGLCSRDRIGDALEILEIMKKKNAFNPNIYGSLINAYLRRNKVSEAIKLFQEAKISGNVSVSTYTNLMQHLFLKNDFLKGLELYSEMLEMGIQLDSVAITAVAAGYIRQNRISEAWQVFKSMDEKDIKPTSKSYTVFLKELCKVSETDEVLRVLNEMQCSKVNIRDDIFREVLNEKLNAIIGIHRGIEEPNGDHCNKQELIAKSEPNQRAQNNLSDGLQESSARLHTNTDTQEVCEILSSSTNWCFIQEKLEKLCLGFTPDLVVEILRKCSLSAGMALKFFSWVGKQEGYSHNEQSYNMAMKIAGQSKNFKEMRSLFHEMRRRGYTMTSDTWTIMIMQYGRTGLTDIALRTFREMKLSGCKPTKNTYNSLIISLCGKKGRKVDEAIKICQEMVRSGCAPDKESVETYIRCLCEVNKLSEAKNCIESLRKFGFSTPLSYSMYFRALCRVGKLEEALALTDEVGSERNLLDQYTYGSLIHGLLQKGQLEEALEKMKHMEEQGIKPTTHVYTSLIIHYLKEKEIDKALKTLERMKQNDCEPTVVTYSALICGYVRSGQVSDAWEVFYRLKKKGPLPDFKTYSMFIDCLCRVGASEEAFKLIFEMLDDGIMPSTVNFRTIIYGLNREGKPNLAQIVLKKKLDLKRRRKMVT